MLREFFHSDDALIGRIRATSDQMTMESVVIIYVLMKCHDSRLDLSPFLIKSSAMREKNDMDANHDTEVSGAVANLRD